MKTVFSLRSDGFGTRILTALHSKLLSEYLDYELEIVWPKINSNFYSDPMIFGMSTVQDIFCERCMFPHSEKRSGRFRDIDAISRGKLRLNIVNLENRWQLSRVELDRQSDLKPLVIYDLPLQMIEFKEHPIDVSSELKRHWRAIGWSKTLIEAIERVDRRLNFSDTIAVHVRRGDVLQQIISGDLDHLSNPRVLEEIFQRYTAIETFFSEIDRHRNGEKILVCSENPDVHEAFIRKYGEEDVCFSGNLFEGTSGQRAAFDVIAMSRAKLLISPVLSFYSECASIVGSCIYIKTPLDIRSKIAEITALLDKQARSGALSNHTQLAAKELIYRHAAKHAADEQQYDLRDDFIASAGACHPR